MKDAHKRLLESSTESAQTPGKARHSSVEPITSPKEAIGRNRRATVDDSVPKAKKRKIYSKAGQSSSILQGCSEDELGEGAHSQEPYEHKPLNEESQEPEISQGDSAAVSRINAMLNNYSATEASLFGDGGSFKSGYSIETSVQRALLPPTPKIRHGMPSQLSEPSTYPTIPNTTPVKPTMFESAFFNESGFQDGEHDTIVLEDGPTASQRSNGTGSDIRVPPTSERTNNMDVHDELSLPPPSTSKHKASKVLKEKEAGSSAANEELNSDDPTIGLPKDQYQPRPSRSRGNQNDSELMIPENFSKRPEAVAKGKRKTKNRRKTTALAKPSPKVETDDEEEDEIKAPAISITKLLPTLEIHLPINCEESSKYYGTEKDDFADDTDLQQVEQPTKFEAAIQGSSPKKKNRGRPKKQAAHFPEDFERSGANVRHETNDEDCTPDATASTHAVPKKQRGRKKYQSATTVLEDGHQEDSVDDEPHIRTNKRRTVIHDDSEEEEEDSVDEEQLSLNKKSNKRDNVIVDDMNDTDLPDMPEPTPAVPKKRGRKKRKVDTETAPTDIEDTNQAATNTDPAPKQRGRKKRKVSPTILSDHEAEGSDSEHPADNIVQDVSPGKVLSLSKDKANTAKEPPSASQSPSKFATPPTTPPKTAKKPDHSPISTTSQVRFRVGLSKKARITPLLRIVRK